MVSRLPEVFDEPFADTSAIPTLLLSRFTREHVTVSLSADAGDETFAGYRRYARALGLHQRVGKMPGPVRGAAAAALSALPWAAIAGGTGRFDQWQRALRLAGTLRAPDASAVLAAISRQYQPPAARRLLSPALRERLGSVGEGGAPGPDLGATTIDATGAMRGASDLQNLLAADYHAFLMNDVLVKVDRATMAYSLEGRDPLMDHRIFEFAATLPDEWKIGPLGGKHILKDIVHRHVPRELVDRPKQGFSPPMAQWLRGELRPILERATDESWLQKQGVFDPRLVSRMGHAFLSGRMNNGRQMWIIVAFQMWYDHWLTT
jgi:asparagine synthase (glutamine-hydrolysing)